MTISFYLVMITNYYGAVTFDQNGLKCVSETNFYLELSRERIGCFRRLVVLIVQFNEFEEVNWEWRNDF